MNTNLNNVTPLTLNTSLPGKNLTESLFHNPGANTLQRTQKSIKNSSESLSTNASLNTSSTEDNLLAKRDGWTGFNIFAPHTAAQAKPSCICAQCASGSSTPPSTSNSGVITKNLAIEIKPLTGITEIDALTYGDKWSTPTITYSFYSNTLNGAYYADTKGVAELSETAKSYIRFILESYIEPFINVDFVETADTATSNGQIRYILSDDASYAHAYIPEAGFNLSGDVHFSRESDHNLDGDGWQAGPGGYGFETLIHETLHALGLKHPGNYNGNDVGTEDSWETFLPHVDDHNTNTVMTYSTRSHYAVSPMPFDIASLQHLYGAKALNNGKTTYSFDWVSGYSDGNRYWGLADADVKLTLWDSGGIDTLDFSKLAHDTRGYILDLNEGGMLTTYDAHDAMTFQARDDASQTTYSTTAFGTAIAYGSIIENAIGSSSKDDILGNHAANWIDGRNGSDWIDGGDHQDTLAGGNGRDFLLGGNGHDTLVGGNGRDDINGGRGNDVIVGGRIALEQVAQQGRVLDNTVDVLIGGGGRDTFVVAPGGGHDIIRDFQDRGDRIRLGLGIDPNQVYAEQKGRNTLLKAGQDVLAILTGVQAHTVTAADIQFQ